MFLGSVTSEYLIQGIVMNSTDSFTVNRTSFPIEYNAVIYKLHKLKIDIGYAKRFASSNSYFKEINKREHNKHYSYILNTNKEIKITRDLFLRQVHNEFLTGDNKATTDHYNLYLYSRTLYLVDLQQILEEWVKEYKTYIKEYTNNKLYYFSY